MATVQTSARARPKKPVCFVDVDHLLARLQQLQAHQKAGGFVSRAGGVGSAIELIRRDLACRKDPEPPE